MEAGTPKEVSADLSMRRCLELTRNLSKRKSCRSSKLRPRKAHKGSQRQSRDGLQLKRCVRPEHGLVSPRALPPRADLLRHIHQSAMALQSADPARRLGIS